jgi:hypothetical protein
VAASEKRGVILRFVVTKAEEETIRKAAKSAGLTLSEYMRGATIPKK